MKSLARFSAAVGIATALALAPAGMAIAAASAAPAGEMGITDLIPANAHKYECGKDYNSCRLTRRDYTRYYNVSDVLYRGPDTTCPGGCGEGYFFWYWPR